MPKALEIAPCLPCNLRCAECPYRKARQQARLLRVPSGDFATPDDIHVMSLDTAQLVLERSREAGVSGAVWTGGGEPTLCEQLPAMLQASARLGMCNGLYTNGIQLAMHAGLAEALLRDTNQVFVRASLNCASDVTAQRFSSASPEDLEAQYAGLAALLKARDALTEQPEGGNRRVASLQVSVIVDEVNVGDLLQISNRVAALFRLAHTHAGSDALVVRPLTKHCRPSYSLRDHDDWVIGRILAVFGRLGSGRANLESAGVTVHLGFGLQRIDDGECATYAEVQAAEFRGRDVCRANGLWLSCGPDATVHLCTDRNCYPEWAIGNLKEQSVAEIYGGPRRRELLDRVHAASCGPSVCEPTCRAARLNGIARCVEAGRVSDVQLAEVAARSAGEPALLLS